MDNHRIHALGLPPGSKCISCEPDSFEPTVPLDGFENTVPLDGFEDTVPFRGFEDSIARRLNGFRDRLGSCTDSCPYT